MAFIGQPTSVQSGSKNAKVERVLTEPPLFLAEIVPLLEKLQERGEFLSSTNIKLIAGLQFPTAVILFLEQFLEHGSVKETKSSQTKKLMFESLLKSDRINYYNVCAEMLESIRTAYSELPTEDRNEDGYKQAVAKISEFIPDSKMSDRMEFDLDDLVCRCWHNGANR